MEHHEEYTDRPQVIYKLYHLDFVYGDISFPFYICLHNYRLVSSNLSRIRALSTDIFYTLMLYSSLLRSKRVIVLQQLTENYIFLTYGNNNV